jgi:hypothetical protein
VREAPLPAPCSPLAASSFRACVATILELAPVAVPEPADDEDPARGWTIGRWLGGLGVGLVEVAGATEFSWPGPWIGAVAPPRGEPRYVVMFGVPSGVVWDPADAGAVERDWVTDGFVIAAGDVALALPPRPAPPAAAGTIEAIAVAPTAGAPTCALSVVEALPGRGLAGDRHVDGLGTFPSGPPGSSLTLIAAEVCESFDPPLTTRGIDLNALVGHDFTIGAVRCRGRRLCEPCRVVQGYAARPVLRPLVHRGGLRADIVSGGAIRLGDPIALLRADQAGFSQTET